MVFKAKDTAISIAMASNAKDTTDPENLVGKVIDGFKVHEVVGRGRLATVFEAMCLNLENSTVAIKVALPGCESILESEKDLFDDLSGGPGIPSMISYQFADEDGPERLVMPFFKKSVRDLMNENGGKLHYKLAAKITMQVAKALKTAHEKGVTHRDVKPENIMTNDGETFYLLDFNLAHRIADKAGKDVKTKDNNLMISSDMMISGDILSVGNAQLSCAGGTDGFRSPEQQIPGAEIGPQSDLYNLGATLYHMVTGKFALGSNFPKASTLDPDVPEWFDNIVDKLLAAETDDRYKTAKGVHSVLKKKLEGELNPAKPVAPAEQVAPTIVYIDRNEPYLSRTWKLFKYPILIGLCALVLWPIVTMIVSYDRNKTISRWKNERLCGKIAALDKNVIQYVHTDTMLEDDPQISKVYTNLEMVNSIIWSTNGENFYLIGKEKEGFVSLYSMDLGGKKKIIYSFKEQDIINKNISLELINCRRADGYDEISMRMSGRVYSVRSDGSGGLVKVDGKFEDFYDFLKHQEGPRYSAHIFPTRGEIGIAGSGRRRLDILEPKYAKELVSPCWYIPWDQRDSDAKAWKTRRQKQFADKEAEQEAKTKNALKDQNTKK